MYRIVSFESVTMIAPATSHCAACPRRWAITLIAGLLAFYGLWAGSSIHTLSPTVDELQHAAGAWNVRYRSDYRPDRENPPLWLHWIGLFLAEGDVPEGIPPDVWVRMRHGVTPPYEYCDLLERGGECDVQRLVSKARVPMLLLAVGLGVAVAAAAWRYGGPVAGVAAAAAFAFEPLMLGHGPLVKNDVVLALCFFGAAVGLKEVVTNGGWPWVALLAVSCGAAINVKFSGILLPVVIVPLGLAIRAAMPAAWSIGRAVLESRGARLAAAAGICAVVLATTWAMIWMSYGFRFAPTRGPERFDVEGLVARTAAGELAARRAVLGPAAASLTAADILRGWQPSMFVRGVVLAHGLQLLPEAAVAGLIFTEGSLLFRAAFLCGRYSDAGFTLFFPAAWLFKTPVTMVALHALGAIAVVRRWRTLWPLLLTLAVFVLSAMTGRINIGLRHLAPAYPFFMLGVGLFIAAAWQAWPRRWAILAATAAAALLTAEVLPHRLEYIQFFSWPFGGARGGLALLSDSNLDWGQDLYRLVAWQRKHPEERLFLCYFGNFDPRQAGLRYENTVGSWAPGPQVEPVSGAMYAVSATSLQGVYAIDALRPRMAAQRRQQPLDVLGGTIYLYRVP